MPFFAALFAKAVVWLQASAFFQVAARWFWLSMLSTMVLGAYALTLGVFNSYLAPLAQEAFNTQYGQFMGLAFPPVAGTCMATFTVALLFSFVWKLKKQMVGIIKGGGN